MINRVLDLQNSTVRNLMRPDGQGGDGERADADGRSVEAGAGREADAIAGVARRRAGERRIVGIVSLRAVLYQADLDLSKTAGEYVKPALYLEEDMRLEEALKRMQRSGQRLAIVLGRDQREVGIVSLQDIFKVIFGEVRL